MEYEQLKEDAELAKKACEAEFMQNRLVMIKQLQISSPVPIPSDFCCPLSLELMTDPVIVASGQTYELAFIKKWIDLGLTVCPKTRQTLAHTTLIPNYTVKALIANWCELNNVKLPDPTKIESLNQPSLRFVHADSSASRDSHIFPHTTGNQQIMAESTWSAREEGLGISRISVASSEDRFLNSEERIMESVGQPSMSLSSPFRKELSTTIDTSEQSSHMHNHSDASGVVKSEPQAAATMRREPEFPSRVVETRSQSQVIWCCPSERFVPVSNSATETKVRKLVEDLKSTSLDTQKEATAELRLLAKQNMDSRVVIANCGAISLLVDLLHSTDTKIQENAVSALLNLSINDNNKSTIVNANAIEPLIHVLQTGNPEARENSAVTLFSLSVIEGNKIKIGRSGAIGPLVDLLGNGTPRGKKDAATALFNLSIHHENKARIVQAGAVKHLVHLMDPAAGMVDVVVAVLANLSTIPEGRVAIGKENGISVLVEVIELGSARGKENAAAALLQLCTNSNRFCSMVLQEGAVPPLAALSQSGTPRAKEKAHALFSCFRNQRHGNGRRG